MRITSIDVTGRMGEFSLSPSGDTALKIIRKSPQRDKIVKSIEDMCSYIDGVDYMDTIDPIDIEEICNLLGVILDLNENEELLEATLLSEVKIVSNDKRAGTALLSEVQTSYSRICQLFGEWGYREDDDGKYSTSLVIEIDSEIYTIYSRYKEWRIGGHEKGTFFSTLKNLLERI